MVPPAPLNIAQSGFKGGRPGCRADDGFTTVVTKEAALEQGKSHVTSGWVSPLILSTGMRLIFLAGCASA
jgi:hypothetical protein